MTSKDITLYHFTCDHGHTGISRTGVLLPNIHPLMRGLGPLLWLTDLAEPPTRESVGLTSRLTTCDRLAYRYIVQTRAAIHWFEVRPRAPKDIVADLESSGGQPEHWWVARRPLTPSEFSFDESWRREEART